jgi:antitoxin component YwqK of YwqJK toxin-antitoxin module
VYYDPFGNVVGVGNYQAGTGVQKAWWPNGKLKREIPYVSNKKHGEERWYDDAGNLERVVVYEDGEMK